MAVGSQPPNSLFVTEWVSCFAPEASEGSPPLPGASLCDPRSAQGHCCPSPRQPCSGATLPLSLSRGPVMGLEGQAVAPLTETLCFALLELA